MKTEQLYVSDPRLLAEFVSPSELKTFFEKRFEVPPDYLGLLMRNGQFVQAYKGAHFSVGGLFHQLKGIIGGSTSISILLADLKTFQSMFDVSAWTKDKVEVLGRVVLDLQINPERPQNIIGLMEQRRSLSKDDAAARLRGHAWERVFEAALGRVNANEVRGNKGLQDLIQADLMKECERIAGDLGLMVRAASVNWAVNDVEKQEAARAAAERETARLEFQFETLKRDLEREHEGTLIRIKNKQDLDALGIKNEEDLRRLVLDNEIQFADARETGVRIAEMKALAHEINLLKTERLAKFEGELQTATHDGVDLKLVHERKRQLERNTEQLDREHGLKLRALEREYERESRMLDRQEQRANRLDDREDLKVQRTEDRDFGFETREKELHTRSKERDFNLETRTKELSVVEKEEYSRMERQREADKVALEKLKGLAGLEAEQERARLERRIREADATHNRDMDVRKLEANREAERLILGAKMTPEQILAVNAGLSPAVAKILEEQAKVQAADKAAQMDLMRQMVEQANRQAVRTEEQARAMFQSGMHGAVGVAHGAGGKGAAPAGAAPGDATVECPKCTRVNPAKAKFCDGCGEQLRR